MAMRFLKIILGVFSFFIVYFLLALVLAYIPSNSEFKPCEKDAVEVYIKTNGVHTDIVMPLRNDLKDWTTLVKPTDTKSKNSNYNFVAFGWGDKGFYLETPTWGDLKFKTAFNAMFFMGKSAMHVTFHKTLKEDKACKRICVTRDSYVKLMSYVESSFVIENGAVKLIEGAGYGQHDLFYDAKGKYSMFYTCNTWANNGLKTAGMKACWWTLFDKGIFDKYD